jgi:hypothetical protein
LSAGSISASASFRKAIERSFSWVKELNTDAFPVNALAIFPAPSPDSRVAEAVTSSSETRW